MPTREEIGERLTKELEANPLPLDIETINTEPITAREILLMSYIILPYDVLSYDVMGKNRGSHPSKIKLTKESYKRFCYPTFKSIPKADQDAINNRVGRILEYVIDEPLIIHKKRTEGRRLSKNSETHGWNNHNQTSGYKRVLMEEFLGSNGYSFPSLNSLEEMATLYINHNGKMSATELFSKLRRPLSSMGGFRKSKQSKKRKNNSRKSKTIRRRRV